MCVCIYKQLIGRDLTLILGAYDSVSPLQYSCPENPMDRGAWRAAVRGGHKSRT